MLFDAITGSRAKFAVALLVILVAGALASRAGKVETTGDPAVLLPEGAESVRALKDIERFRSGDVTSAVVVAYRDGGLRADDRERLDALKRELDAAELPRTGPVAPARYSEDGAAGVVIAGLRDTGEDEVVDAVRRIRAAAAAAEGFGLEIAVTGGAGFAADVEGVFGGIDGVVLIGAGSLVLLLLILIYRSPIFWVIPFFTVMLAEGASRGWQYVLGELGLSLTGQATGIASVLTFGAATDYALLLVARYREELIVHEDRHVAMRAALQSAAPAIIASALTVAFALLTLLLADVGGTKALGPLSASGVLLAMLFSLTILPATLLIAGRRAFWPRIPRYGAAVPDPDDGLWGRLGERIRRRPRPVWLAGAAVLAVLALGLVQLDLGLAQDEQFAGKPEAIEGQELLARGGFPPVSPDALQVVVRDAARADAVTAALRRLPSVASVADPERGEPGALLGVRVRADPFGAEALAAVPEIRRSARRAGGPDTLVGGQLAEDLDTREAAERDNLVVVPVALAAVLLILIALLRALVLPVVLIVTVIASFAAAFGAGVVVSDVVFGFDGVETTLPLIAFIFLVALGVDYNIFLVARAREETARHGSDQGMLRALAATGAVITSAGIVLAGTFSILGLIPFVGLVELGFIIAFGVLLDTLLVRSVIVPAVVWDAGPRVWWPSALGRHVGSVEKPSPPVA
jgi:RND superfamily putative drug exporter